MAAQQRKVGRKPGRPTTYTEAKALAICRLIAEGKSLNSICKAADMPAMWTVFRWRAEHKDFSDKYAHARCDQADAHVEEMLDVARKASKAESSEESQGYRLLVDTLKWRASKMKPKNYAEKLLVEADVNMRTLTDEELNARIASLVERQSKA